jgi:alanine racemase
MNARPVWAEISRLKLLHNYGLLRSLAAPAEMMAVVKANAYGHGALACAQALAAGGAQWLGVTDVTEGVAVRAVCPEAKILVMVGLWPGEAEAVIADRLSPVVWEAVHLDEAARAGKPLGVHLEIDTGMSRQGVRIADLPALLDKLRLLPSVRLEGVMTHFHSPEMLDCPATEEQFARFVTAIDIVYGHGFRPEFIHAGNSATVLISCVDELVNLAKKYGAKAMMRAGLSLYGYAPRFTGSSGPGAVNELRPVLAWKSRITSLRTIEPGENAGYCATFRATRQTKLALLPAGYADGLNRLLSNCGAALVRGKRAPIAGRVSMDLTILDVTDIPGVEIGDEAVLIGEQGPEKITAYDHANMTGTIPYEVLCNLSTRVPRIMVD